MVATSKVENKQTWGIKTAVRLRAVLASFPDLSPEDRNGYLLDEIGYALDDASSIPGESRDSLLEALEDHFPVYGEGTLANSAASPAAAPKAIEAPSVADMVDELCNRAGELTSAQMTKLAGVVAISGNQSPAALIPESLSNKLAFPANSAEMDDFLKSVNQLWLEMGITEQTDSILKLNRILKMLGILTGGFRDIYRFVWPYWNDIAPREIRNQVSPAFPNGLDDEILSFVTGGGSGSGEFYKEIDKTKKVLVSILFGLRKGAEDYGKLYERKLSPESIQDTVALEESASDVSRVREIGRKCWDKYTQLTKHQTAEAIHDEIVEAVAEAAFNNLKLSS